MPTRSLARLVPATLAALCLATPAAAATLTQEDVALAIHASADGTAWMRLDTANLVGFFGVHRCLCPDTLGVVLELTPSGQDHLGNSTLGATFLLGQSCATSTSTCQTLGSISFSRFQAAASPTFSSDLVFQSAERTTAYDCANLSAGATMVWAFLTQDGEPLAFVPTLSLPVVTTPVDAPRAVEAEPANQGLLVSWSRPLDIVGVAGYQVLCLPRPEVAQPAAYETCGLASSGAAIDPVDPTQVCSAFLSTSTTSVRLSDLANGTAYTVAVISVDVSGGVSALSPTATATPQPTQGFWEKYQQAGGEASGCSLAPRPSGGPGLFLLLVAALAWRARRGAWLLAGVVLAAEATAFAQDGFPKANDDWARAESWERPAAGPPAWAVELGLSWYRPAVDQEFSDGNRPFAETFSNARHPLWEVEVVRYLGHRPGAWGVGLRTGYYKVTAAAFLSDGITRSGDETGLRLIPFSPSLLFRANRVPGLKVVPLIPYAKLGLDATYWTVATTGSRSRSGFSWGWHGAAGMMLGFAWLGSRSGNPEGVADPCALFFEWDYLAVNGLGMANNLHMGDSTWFAGIMFDL